MSKILVGIDGSERGVRALTWAAKRAAATGAEVTCLLVIDPRFTRGAREEAEAVRAAAVEAISAARDQVTTLYPHVATRALTLEGKVLDSLVDAAKDYDLVVLGSHHGSSARENIGGAKGLRVAVSTTTPTAVVPSDWSPDDDRRGIVVGIAVDDSSDEAVRFGVEEALRSSQPLRLVSTWGLPAFLSRPAKALGGELAEVGTQHQQRLDALVAQLREEHPGLEVAGEAVEGASPTRAMLDYCRDYGTLVLGTHTTSALGRTLFGSLTHSVLMNLEIPTVVVSRE